VAGGSTRLVISLEKARSQVLQTVEVLGAEPVSIWESSGRVLALDVVAEESVPPFENSAMDGYAVHGADVIEPGAVLEVIGDLAAGFVAGSHVGPGQALKIMTGAPMPDGADTVGSSPDEFTRYIESELVKWAKVARDAGIQPE